MSPLRQRMVPIPAVRVPCPAAQRRGHGQRGRLLFGVFLLATQEKDTAPPGAHPGMRPWQRQAAIKTMMNPVNPSAAAPRLRRLRTPALGKHQARG